MGFGEPSARAPRPFHGRARPANLMQAQKRRPDTGSRIAPRATAERRAEGSSLRRGRGGATMAGGFDEDPTAHKVKWSVTVIPHGVAFTLPSGFSAFETIRCAPEDGKFSV